MVKSRLGSGLEAIELGVSGRRTMQIPGAVVPTGDHPLA